MDVKSREDLQFAARAATRLLLRDIERKPVRLFVEGIASPLNGVADESPNTCTGFLVFRAEGAIYPFNINPFKVAGYQVKEGAP